MTSEQFRKSVQAAIDQKMSDARKQLDTEACEECHSEPIEPRMVSQHLDAEGLCRNCKIKLGYL